MIICEINDTLVNLITICIIGGIALIALIFAFIIACKCLSKKKLLDKEK